MAEKKALVIMAAAAELSTSLPNIDKLLKKSAVVKNYTDGKILDGTVAEETIVNAKPEWIADAFEKGAMLVVSDLGSADAKALDAALEIALEAADRRTVVAVIGKGAVAFYGLSINTKAGELTRAGKAADILPTLAYVADFPLTEACTGAIIYQALKSPNLKMDEVSKLKEAIARMESVVARDNREPWDKHDCA